jgi:CTP:molybdopterin cytidylyltransferase MocA
LEPASRSSLSGCRPASLGDPRLHWIRPPPNGLSLSLRLGIEAIAGEVSAVVILLGDQPAASPRRSGRSSMRVAIDPAAEAQVLAPPVLVEQTHFHLFDDLVGDIGLREILRLRSDLVTSVGGGSCS